MPYLVTGANGFIGSRLCLKLAEQGQKVVAFCRNSSGSADLNHGNILIATGDVRDKSTIIDAMKDCSVCFHLACIARQWSPNRDDFFDTNVGGTVNALESAVQCRLSRFVYTSSAGIFGHTETGIIDEQTELPEALGTLYEQSKQLADKTVLEYAERGLNAVVVNPTRTFGPGPLTEANSLTRIMAEYEQGKWRVLPGSGVSIGNYVFIDDVVDGHLKALRNGNTGERYILGGENLSFNAFFDLVKRHSHSQHDLIHVPRFAIMLAAYGDMLRATCCKKTPRLTPGFARRYFRNYRVSSERARLKLGYKPVSADIAVRRTMAWLRDSGLAG